MSRRVLLPLTCAVMLSLAACAPSGRPAPLWNFGYRGDSATGGIMVQEDDTLWAIAQRYRLPIRSIIDLNNLAPPYDLAAGQRLKMPAPLDYRAKSGDDINTIASMFGVSVSNLVKVNNLQAPYRLKYGQMLRIPSTYQGDMATNGVMIAHDEAPEPKVVPSVRPDEVVMEELAPLSMPAPVATATLDAPAAVQKQMFALPPPSPPAQPPVMTSASKRPNFMWPVRGQVISGYGAKDNGLFNDGINIAVPKGTPVQAAAEGVVAYVGDDLKSYGNLVLIRHSGGTMTAYAHLGAVRIKKGMKVKKGQPIGVVGTSGTVTSSQLHFEIRQGAKTLDPKKFLG